MADQEKRLRYCESTQGIEHAWITIKGKVVDVTAEASTRALRRMGYTKTCSYDYVGVVINRRTVFRKLWRNGCWNSIIERPKPPMSREQRRQIQRYIREGRLSPDGRLLPSR
jgi:hypothetical protein